MGFTDCRKKMNKMGRCIAGDTNRRDVCKQQPLQRRNGQKGRRNASEEAGKGNKVEAGEESRKD